MDGTKYPSGECEPTDSEEEYCSSQPTFGTQNTVRKYPNGREEITVVETGIKPTQQERTNAEEVRIAKARNTFT